MFLAFSPQLFASDWYVNVAIGGTRWSAIQTSGQCDGSVNQSYAAAGGVGTNLHCAFSDIRYFWTDSSFTNNPNAGAPAWGWIGAGGDHYHIIGCTASGTTGCRIGQSGPNSGDYFGLAGDNTGAGWPLPPAGTSGAHTVISGPSAGSKAYLNGGYGVNPALHMAGSNYVDLLNIDLTQLSSCGRAAQVISCNTGFPVDDFTTNGINWSNSSTNTTLTDINIHGMASAGMIGATGDGVSLLRVTMSGNAAAGWDLDDGGGQTGTGALTMSYVNVIGNGCKEIYPITGTVPIGIANGQTLNVGAFADCTDDNLGGYGDGIGTATVASSPAWIFSIDHSTAAYNTQDGFDLLHLHGSGSQLNITKSIAYGNMGQQIKAGSDGSNVNNNLLVTNCNALRQAIPGFPGGYNANLSDFCRAADSGTAMGVNDGTTLALDFNTIYSASSTAIELDCTSSCTTATLIDFRNNVFVGFLNNTANGYPGGGTGDFSNPIFYAISDPFTNAGSLYSHNVTYHPKSTWTCPAPGETNAICSTPQLTDMTWHLYGAGNMSPASGTSAVVNAGTTIGGITVDYSGNARPQAPSTNPAVGALEFFTGSTSPNQTIGSGTTFGSGPTF